MSYLVNLVRKRDCEGQVFVDTFSVDDKVTDPEQAMRDAVEIFLKLGTPDSKRAKEYTCGDFNWGDAVTFLTDEDWSRFGLTMVQNRKNDIIVNQDEVLIEEEEV